MNKVHPFLLMLAIASYPATLVRARDAGTDEGEEVEVEVGVGVAPEKKEDRNRSRGALYRPTSSEMPG